MTTPPTVEWKLIADTLDELKALGDANVEVLTDMGNIATWDASSVLAEYRHNSQTVVAWSIIPRPKPAPTEAELEKAVVEAAIGVPMYRNGHEACWDVFDAAVKSLLAHRAKKGGGE